MKIISTIFYTLFIAVLLSIAGLLIGSMLPIPGNIELKIVKSGSMEPAIPTGSLVVVKPSRDYAQGDVITFGADTRTDIPTTHRIVGVELTKDGPLYVTKGDANEEADPNPVAMSNVIGKVVFHIPGAGYVLDFARQPLGFALLIGIPAGLVILEELVTICKEITKGRRRRRDGRDDGPGTGAGRDDEGAPLRKVQGRRFAMDEVFVPIYVEPRMWQREWWHTRLRFHKDAYGSATMLVMGLVFVSSMMAGGAGGTLSYFNDIERSLGNVFQAGTWEPLVAQEEEPESEAQLALVPMSVRPEDMPDDETPMEGEVLGEKINAPAEEKPDEEKTQEPARGVQNEETDPGNPAEPAEPAEEPPAEENTPPQENEGTPPPQEDADNESDPIPTTPAPEPEPAPEPPASPPAESPSGE